MRERLTTARAECAGWSPTRAESTGQVLLEIAAKRVVQLHLVHGDNSSLARNALKDEDRVVRQHDAPLHSAAPHWTSADMSQ